MLDKSIVELGKITNAPIFREGALYSHFKGIILLSTQRMLFLKIVFQIVQFSELDKLSLRFIRQILIGILLCEDQNACQAVFINVAQSEKLKMFRESLKLFIQHFLVRNLKLSTISVDEKELLNERSKLIDNILEIHNKKIKL